MAGFILSIFPSGSLWGETCLGRQSIAWVSVFEIDRRKHSRRHTYSMRKRMSPRSHGGMIEGDTPLFRGWQDSKGAVCVV